MVVSCESGVRPDRRRIVLIADDDVSVVGVREGFAGTHHYASPGGLVQ